MDQALALVELTSIVRGYRVADDMVKKAPVRLLDMGIVSPGKFLILITGDVGSVEEAYLAGLAGADGWLVDHLFLPQPHEGVIEALERRLPRVDPDAVGLLETFSAVSAIRAADVALKAAEVVLMELHYERHLGGKGYFALTGDLHDVEAALSAAVGAVGDQGLLLKQELIPRPHEDLVACWQGGTRPDFGFRDVTGGSDR